MRMVIKFANANGFCISSTLVLESSVAAKLIRVLYICSAYMAKLFFEGSGCACSSYKYGRDALLKTFHTLLGLLCPTLNIPPMSPSIMGRTRTARFIATLM